MLLGMGSEFHYLTILGPVRSLKIWRFVKRTQQSFKERDTIYPKILFNALVQQNKEENKK